MKHPQHRVLILNSKGGCGKTTVTTNLVSYLASVRREKVALIDHDPLACAIGWLSDRPADESPIHGVEIHNPQGLRMTRSWQMRIPVDTRWVVMDAPAGQAFPQINELINGVDTLIVPVAASAIDIRSSKNFLKRLFAIPRIRNGAVRVGVVGNRVDGDQDKFEDFEQFLEEVGVPCVVRLRDATGYRRAVGLGKGIHELPEEQAGEEAQQWLRLYRWLAGAD